MKNIMNKTKLFSQVAKVGVNRSRFDRSHSHLTAFDFDKLVPIFVDPVIPGDTHIMKASIFARLNTPINPLFSQMYLDSFWFFVPLRLVWNNYYKFFGGQDNPGDSISYSIPRENVGTAVANDLRDYMGLPVGVSMSYSVIPLRCYHLIFDQWFRDENLQESADVDKGDTGTVINNTGTYGAQALHIRGKRHDYFTSCLPWAQKQTTEVTIPLGDTAPVVPVDQANQPPTFVGSTSPSGTARNLRMHNSTLTDWNSVWGADADALWKDPGLEADLTQATQTTINQLRSGIAIQHFLERDARGGTRYTSKIYAQFGVESSDARLQRCEYLGGSTARINVSPIPQQSSTDATTPQGNLAAMATVTEGNTGFTKSFTEHGYIIGMVSARSDLIYQQGIERHWSYDTQYDFFWPDFAGLGEQAVKNQEIMAQGTGDDALTFGYQERYSELRYKNSMITGIMRSTHATPLDSWHLGQEFATLPTLSSDFIESDTPVDRVVAVTSEPHLMADIWFDLISVRPMPVHGIPGLTRI